MEISAALSSLGTCVEIARTALAARDHAKAQAAVSDMATTLTATTMASLKVAETARMLQARVAELEQQLRELESRQRERENYVLREIAPGNFAYALEPRDEATKTLGVPAHHVCQPCFDKGVKAVLGLTNSRAYGLQAFCPACKLHIAMPST